MNIVINGATRGIGKAVATYLTGNKENKIIVTGRNRKALKELSDYNPDIYPYEFDIANLDALPRYYDFISSRFKKVDVLINMAALLISKKFVDFTDAEARKIMDTNVIGPAACIRILVPLMSDGSHIVNISSMGGYLGSSKYTGLSWYSTSKAAIACLTECLAVELKNEGIRVNCLALGSVQTEMFSEAFPGLKAQTTAEEMGEYIAEFALKGHRVFNGKVLPVAVTNP